MKEGEQKFCEIKIESEPIIYEIFELVCYNF